MRPWVGTLLFYVTAFVANAVLLPLTFWLYDRAQRGASEPGDSYYGIVQLIPPILTAVPVTLGMWLLRRLARWFDWTRWWQWLPAGALIGLITILGAGKLGLSVESAYFPAERQSLKAALMFLLLGPMTFTFQPWWLPLPALLAVCSALFLVQRALGWQNEEVSR